MEVIQKKTIELLYEELLRTKIELKEIIEVSEAKTQLWIEVKQKAKKLEDENCECESQQ